MWWVCSEGDRYRTCMGTGWQQCKDRHMTKALRLTGQHVGSVCVCVHVCACVCVCLYGARGHSRARKGLEHNQSLGSQAVWSALWAGYCNSYKQRLLSNQGWVEEGGSERLREQDGRWKSSYLCKTIDRSNCNSFITACNTQKNNLCF